MDDRRAHFLVLVGNVCNDARTGAFAVELVMGDGDTHSGVPDPKPATDDSRDEVDSSGWSEDLRIGGTSVHLQDVSEIHIYGP